MLLANGPVIHPAPFDEISFDLCSRRKDVVMMSADLSKYCQIIQVKTELPDQHLDVGMAETESDFGRGRRRQGGFVPVATTFLLCHAPCL